MVEVERRCPDARCGARARIGLTKREALVYDGWKCERCEQRWEDVLSERDIPDWWEELFVTGLYSLRPKPEGGGATEKRAGGPFAPERGEDD